MATPSAAPPKTEAENKRLIAVLTGLDERKDRAAPQGHPAIVGNNGLTTGILKGRRNISVAIAKRLARCPACAR